MDVARTSWTMRGPLSHGRASPPNEPLEVSMDVISHFAARYERSKVEELTLEEYLDECKRNPLAYATAAERIDRKSVV